MTKNNYLYADKNEQVKRANTFLVFGFDAFYAVVLALIWIACARGIRTIAYTGGFTAFVVLLNILLYVLFQKEKSSTKLRYVSLIGMVITSTILIYAFHNYYVNFMTILPFIGCILFYDKKFSLISGVSIAAVNIIMTLIKLATPGMYTGEDRMDQLCSGFIVCMGLLLMFLTARVVKKFIEDSIGSLMEHQKTQQNLFDNVIEISKEVKSGTMAAMDIVTELNQSSETVKSAMQDISDSTLNTAENIQTQTNMTQDIQESITKTQDRSEHMVSIAKESSELNANNIDTMNRLKSHSDVITKTNAEVAESMKQLTEKTKSVIGIADTIFAISSQTNLLALNASIESARAGEAGRGFAVVADQIRQLAEQTRKETERIAEILDALSENATQASGAVDKSVEAATSQTQMIEDASEGFQHMSNNVGMLINDIDSIDQMINQLSKANEQIVENIMNLSATTEEVTASSNQAADLSTTNLDKAESAKKLLEQVLQSANKDIN